MLVVRQQTERESANHQVAVPCVKTDCMCMEKKLPFDPTSAIPVRIDHPSISTGDTGLPLDERFEPPPPSEIFQVGNGDEENGFVTATSATKEPVLAVEILMDSDCLETHEECDLTTVVLADKGKGINPREYGGALYDPNSMIVPAGTTSTWTPLSSLASIRTKECRFRNFKACPASPSNGRELQTSMMKDFLTILPSPGLRGTQKYHPIVSSFSRFRLPLGHSKLY